MVPDDASALIRAVYDSKPTPQVCVSTAGAGGQAISWLLGVPGASACLLEATVPYCFKAFEDRMAAGSRAPGYCSREAAEGLARNAYARAVSLCVAESPDRGPHVLPDRRVIAVGCTAAVLSSKPRRGPHQCYVCAQTADGLAHYELTLSKGRRDRSGEDAAVSRLLLQAIADAVGVPVPFGFKADHLLLNGGGGGNLPSVHEEEGVEAGRGAAVAAAAAAAAGEAETVVSAEVVPAADLAHDPDAIEELVAGRCGTALVVPRDTRGATNAAGEAVEAGAPVVVLREGAMVRAALPRGATVILPGSYNPLHRGHVGLLEAARSLLDAEINGESRRGETPQKPPAADKAAAGWGREGEQGVQADEGMGAGAASADGGSGGLDVDAGGGDVGHEERERKRTAVHGIFEISVSNVDKGGLGVEEIQRRVMQFSEPGGVGWPYPVAVTKAPLFSEKARLFPGCAFVVGADTAKRIIDPRYYGNSQVEMVSALSEIRHLGCSFIVGGREDAGGRFLTLDGVLAQSGLPESLRSMFLGLDESSFREDLSSSSIRAGVASPGL
ncbi:unnamed protein product [Ectocarpus sp. 6 AP-2014]